MTEDTYYSLLEVDQSASTEEIKRAYRRLAREYHPDTLPPEFRARRIGRDAEVTFKLLTEAYDVLSDPVRRREYDALLRRLEGTERDSTPPPVPSHPTQGTGPSSTAPPPPPPPPRPPPASSGRTSSPRPGQTAKAQPTLSPSLERTLWLTFGLMALSLVVGIVKQSTTRSPASPRTPQMAPGLLTVRSNVRDDLVLVDGRRLGPTPVEVTLAAGQHSVVLLKSGCEPQSRSLTLGQQAREEIRFEVDCGSVSRVGSFPERIVDLGACPFECCVYRQWIARKPTPLYSEPDTDSRVVRSIAIEEPVQAVDGFVSTLRTGRILLGHDVKDYSYKEPKTLTPGDLLPTYHYLGEGCWKVWLSNTIADVCPSTHEIVATPETVWWVQMRLRDSTEGWTNQPDNFGNKDACG